MPSNQIRKEMKMSESEKAAELKKMELDRILYMLG